MAIRLKAKVSLDVSHLDVVVSLSNDFSDPKPVKPRPPPTDKVCLLTVEPHPIVTICVESPKDSPVDEHKNLPQTPTITTPPIETVIQERSANIINEPIDVNIPRDTSNIFYDYDETILQQQRQHYNQPPPRPPRRHEDTHSLPYEQSAQYFQSEQRQYSQDDLDLIGFEKVSKSAVNKSKDSHR